MNATATRLLMTFATGSLIGSGFVLAKLLLNGGFSQTAMGFVQVSGAAAVMFVLMRLQGLSYPANAATVRYFLVSASIGVLAGPLLGNWVMARIPSGTFTLLLTLSPMFTALISASLDRRWPELHTLVGSATGLIGAALVLLPGAEAFQPEQSLAMSVALGVPLLLAIANVYRSRRWPSGLAAPAAASGTLLTQALVLAPLALALPAGLDAGSLLSSWPLLALLILTTVAGNLSGAILQKSAGPTAYSQIGYVIALSGVAASSFVFGEDLGPLFWPGLLLVFVGVLLTNAAARSVAVVGPAVVRDASACPGSTRDSARAGVRPKNMPAAKVTAVVTSITRQSRLTVPPERRSRAVSSDTNAISNCIEAVATSRPRTDPAAARSSDSVRTWRISRPRVAPSDARVAISR
jgi:drug/metabolite transporter (DMT)-like permease